MYTWWNQINEEEEGAYLKSWYYIIIGSKWDMNKINPKKIFRPDILLK